MLTCSLFPASLYSSLAIQSAIPFVSIQSYSTCKHLPTHNYWTVRGNLIITNTTQPAHTQQENSSEYQWISHAWNSSQQNTISIPATIGLCIPQNTCNGTRELQAALAQRYEILDKQVYVITTEDNIHQAHETEGKPYTGIIIITIILMISGLATFAARIKNETPVLIKAFDICNAMALLSKKQHRTTVRYPINNGKDQHHRALPNNSTQTLVTSAEAHLTQIQTYFGASFVTPTAEHQTESGEPNADDHVITMTPAKISEKTLNLKPINGVRVLSLAWIIAGHTVNRFVLDAPINLQEILDASQTVYSLFILNGFLAVSTFFFLSAFLVAYAIFAASPSAKFNYFNYVILRWLRTTPALMLTLCILWSILPHLGEGPFWYTRQSRWAGGACRDAWWTLPLYISNIYPNTPAKSCMSWAWYLSADFQLYMIAPFLLWTAWRGKQRLFFGGCISAIVASILITGIVSYIYKLPALVTPVSGSGLTVADYKLQFEDWMYKFYTQASTHLPSYVVGLCCGYFVLLQDSADETKYATEDPECEPMMLYERRAAPRSGMLSRSSIILGLGIMLATLVIPVVWTRDSFNFPLAFSVLYNSLHFLIWTIGLALVVIPLVLCPEDDQLISRFLGADFWTPLAKISYPTYLIHPVLLEVLYGNIWEPHTYRPVELAIRICGVVTLSFAVGCLIFLFVESPISSLIRNLLRKTRD